MLTPLSTAPLDDLSFIDILIMEESPLSPNGDDKPPLFADELPGSNETIEDALPSEPELEPEWMQDFDPWVLEAIRRYEAMEVTG